MGQALFSLLQNLVAGYVFLFFAWVVATGLRHVSPELPVKILRFLLPKNNWFPLDQIGFLRYMFLVSFGLGFWVVLEECLLRDSSFSKALLIGIVSTAGSCLSFATVIDILRIKRWVKNRH